MRYLTPDFIKAYESANQEARKRMLRTILETWDFEYQNVISCGVSPDTVWDIGNRPIGYKIGTDGTDEYN